MEKEKNKTELEEAIETIKNSYVMSTKHCLDDENTRLRQAIEVVLQALERYKQLAEAKPKKKIEDRIKELWKEKQELQDNYDKNIDKWIEEGKKAANEHKDRFTPYIPAREEIGIEQKIQNILGAIIELEKICNKF